MRQVVAHGRLATRGDDHHLGGVLVCTHLIKNFGEIGKRHVVLLGEHTAIGTAMPTVEVAAQGAFPEKLVKFVLVNTLFQHSMIEFEHHSFIKAQTLAHFFSTFLSAVSHRDYHTAHQQLCLPLA